MDAVSAEESVCGGECARQTARDVTLRQILQRAVTGRNFVIDAQSWRIIGQNGARKLRSGFRRASPQDA